MALPPSPVPSGASPIPPPGMGAGPMDAEPMDAPEGEEGGEPEVVATILKNSDGTYTLLQGDEPEPAGEEMAGAPGEPPAAPQGQDFDTAPALIRGIIAMLDEDGGAEDAFAGGFAAGKGPSMGASAGGPPKPPMGGM